MGFSKDIRSSLRNVYFRQPEKCHSYRFVDLPELDQKQMGIIRNTWLLQEGDRVPPGHAEEKDLWLRPPRGDAAAAEAHLQKLRDNGLVEEMEIDATKLNDEGVMELLPSKHALTPQEIEAKEKQEAYDKANTFIVSETFGERKKQIDFELYIELSFKTNGGWMYDVDITMDETITSHRITVSDFFLELVNVEAPEMLKRTFVYLYGNKAVRSTERNVRLHSLLSSSLSSCPSQFTTMHIRARYTQTCHSSSVYIYIYIYMCMSRCARSLTDHNDNVFPPMCIVHTPSHLSAMSLLCAHTHTLSLSLPNTIV